MGTNPGNGLPLDSFLYNRSSMAEGTGGHGVLQKMGIKKSQ